MYIEPFHIVRLYKNKYLIDILRFCLNKAYNKEMVTKELLNEVYVVVKDI